ncbi:hypothetical protein LTR05_002981 [Lithohypha guttulata]|uniref:Arrestin-like N-terminal domain-containing protein n=1 Tax=Lithohypha guttulata TaxID=1690604 RepID=A0AAN7T5U6_9EURO|nr:hypothetical protein LTR05_002981 [Lithohypha guttulata]
MALQIKLRQYLDADPATFEPGETISGSVVYRTIKQRSIQHAAISFDGSIKIEYIPTGQNNAGLGFASGPRRPNKYRNTLIDDRVTLFEGPYDVPPQVFEWPFEFTIPQTCRLIADGESIEQMRSVSPNTTAPGEDVLPPSYVWHHQTIGRNARVDVVYKLSVDVKCSGLLNNDSIERVVTIRQQQGHPISSTDQKPTRCDFPSISWASNSLRLPGERVSFKQKMKSTFSSDPALKPPSLSFKAAAYLPHNIGLSQRFKIGMSVEQQKLAEHDSEDPSLLLEKMSLTLKTHTTIAVPKTGLFTQERLCQGEEILAQHEVLLGNNGIDLPTDGRLVDAADGLCLQDWLKDDHKKILASLETSILHVGYRLAVDIILRHEKTNKQFRLGTQGPFALFNTVESAQGKSNYGISEQEEALPTYTAKPQ